MLDETGSIGDLNAIFLDMADDSIMEGLSVTGDDVTGMVLNADSVTKVDSYTNINGEVVKEAGKIDAGVQFGTSGIGEDDIRETSFVLSHSDMNLTIDALLGQDFAARLTSVGAEDGDRDGSLKIGGETPTDPDPEEPTNIAIDDLLVVNEDETFNTDGSRDVMEGATGPQYSVLENDVLDDFYFFEEVQAVNGDAASVNQVVTGSNGGQMIIYSDGSVDFNANGEFDALNEGDSLQTQFTYAVDGGDTATVTVQVNGLEGEPPLDPGIDPL